MWGAAEPREAPSSEGASLYGQYGSKASKEALESQDLGEHVAQETGSLREDMLILLIGAEQELESSTWGAMVPQLVAAAATDPDMSDMLRKSSVTT